MSASPRPDQPDRAAERRFPQRVRDEAGAAGDAQHAPTTVAAPARSATTDAALAALRVVAGLMLVQHGLQKHFGLLLPPDRPFGGAPALLSQPWIAGTLEIAGGVLLALGLFTRPVAFVLSGLMAAAYFIAHAPRGFWPILNGGELSALYCFVFLALSALAPGRFALDALRARRSGRVT